MAHRHLVPAPRPSAATFIGSFFDEPDQALIVLRGDVDAATVDRLGVHIDDVLAAAARFLTIDARDVDRYAPALLNLLGRTQHRLGRHHGLLQVQGLRDSRLTGGEPAPAAQPEPDRLGHTPAHRDRQPGHLQELLLQGGVPGMV
ncbi:MAG: hypothetical protein L0I76_16580 [Pseudonocardia sp.]|nr:hypothetical protein [Pseudonocardia sp.]